MCIGSINLEPEILTPTSLYVYNKIDGVSLEFLDQLAREPYTAVMSCELDLGVQEVVERIWKELRLMRLYTKRYDLPLLSHNAVICSMTLHCIAS